MSDVVGWVMIAGMIVLGGYGAIKIGIAIMRAIYENQSLIISLPFP